MTGTEGITGTESDATISELKLKIDGQVFDPPSAMETLFVNSTASVDEDDFAEEEDTLSKLIVATEEQADHWRDYSSKVSEALSLKKADLNTALADPATAQASRSRFRC